MFDAKTLYRQLISHRLVSGSEWLNGSQFDVEPQWQGGVPI